MIRVIALLTSLAIVMSAPASETCAGCTARTVFTRDWLKPSHVTTTSGEDTMWIVAEETGTTTKRIMGVDETSGASTTVAELFAQTVLDFESDALALYVVTTEPPHVRSEVIRVEKSTGQKETVVSLAAPVDIRLDDTHLYWAFGRQIQRVAKTGGTVESIYTAPGTFTSIIGLVLDDVDVFFAETAPVGYVLRAIGKRDGTLRFIASAPAASALAVDDQWLYVGVSSAIARVLKTGGNLEQFTPLRPFVELATPSVREMVVRDGRAYVRQTNAVLRGCASETMAVYSAGGRVEPFASLGGDFVVTSCSLFYVPTRCFLIPPQPPFTVERICLDEPETRRRATRR